jgi:hypothetical protein
MRGLYILDENRNVIPCTSILEWGVFMQDDAHRNVAVRCFGKATLSTVFLGLDHSLFRGTPQVFETAILDDERVIVIDRYSTWADAEAGHAGAVAALTKGEG